ncbi:hypothetical protein [Novipirellula caenicola]|uniref:Uncharacterized protein n=1 Tax=Novipirellula caenicola TaxID=1536901 RepID=A0ABP9VI18_9BACT
MDTINPRSGERSYETQIAVLYSFNSFTSLGGTQERQDERDFMICEKHLH